MKKKTETVRSKDVQLAAMLASAVVVAGFVLYWTIQILDVREMLAMAYG
jgi:hypothetical protein